MKLELGSQSVLVAWVVVGLVSFSSCQRSPAFRRDPTVPRAELPSYYNKNTLGQGKTPAERIESMGQPRKRVMVLDFWNDTPVRTSAPFGSRPTEESGPALSQGQLGQQVQEDPLGSFSADELRRSLLSTGRLILPTDIRSERSTADFVQGEHVKVAQLIREGRKQGVAVLIIGRISKIVFRQRGDEIGLFRQKQSLAAANVELKLFDVVNGREVAAFGKSGESSANALLALERESVESREYRQELIQIAIRNAIAQLYPDVLRSIEKMTWEGHVAKVSGKKIFINAGRTSGLVAGDILKVMTQGDDVYDSTTGAYLGRAAGQLKGTLELVDFIGTDGAVGEVHTGGNFQEGDPVQLY